MTLRTAGLAAAISCLAAASACGGNPSGPTQSTGGGNSGSSGPACRTYAASGTVTIQSPLGGTQTLPTACVWDGNQHQLTCTVTAGPSGPVCTTTVTTYNSTADFVDEIQVIPPRLLRTSDVQTVSGAAGCAAGAFQNISYVYDAQRRVTQVVNGFASTLYSAWDSSGRPTQGTISSGAPVTISYDSSARTETRTVGAGTAAVVTITTFDATGTPINVVTRDGGVATTTIRVASTAQVCK